MIISTYIEIQFKISTTFLPIPIALADKVAEIMAGTEYLCQVMKSIFPACKMGIF